MEAQAKSRQRGEIQSGLQINEMPASTCDSPEQASGNHKFNTRTRSFISCRVSRFTRSLAVDTAPTSCSMALDNGSENFAEYPELPAFVAEGATSAE
jgi:hypothetical protein